MSTARAAVEETFQVRFVRKDVADGDENTRFVLGTVLVPEETDDQEEIYSHDCVRDTAWDFLLNFRNAGLQHEEGANGRVELVESYVAPVDFEVEGPDGVSHFIKKGTWLLGYRIPDDEIWEAVKAGEYTGLSIGGTKWVETLAEPAAKRPNDTADGSPADPAQLGLRNAAQESMLQTTAKGVRFELAEKSTHPLSHDQVREQLSTALREHHGVGPDDYSKPRPYLQAVYDKKAVYEHGGQLHQVAYKVDGGKLALHGEHVPVRQAYLPIRAATKGRVPAVRFELTEKATLHSHEQVRDALQTALKEHHGIDSKSSWDDEPKLRAVYDDRVVYERQGQHQQAAYKLDENGTATLAGEHVPVHQTYLPLVHAEKAAWTAATINTLPDAAFGYVSPGGQKDAEGRTTPRSLRHLPYRTKDGAVDLPHLRNALARLTGTQIPAHVKGLLKTKFESLLGTSGGGA